MLWNVGTSNAFNTTLNGNVGAADTSIALTSVTGLQTSGVLCVDRQNLNGVNTPAVREYFSYTGISGNTVTGVTRGLGGSTAQTHTSGALVEELFSVSHWNDLVTALLNVHTSTGALDTTKVADLSTAQAFTNKTLTDSTNNVMAKSLKSATTTIDVSAATAPTANQVLTATDSTHATWQAAAATSNTTAKARAYMTGNNAVTSAVFTKVPLNAETYDPGNNFDSATNFRFIAPIAGKYQVNASTHFASMTDGTECIVAIYKNGSAYVQNVYFSKTTGNQSSPGISDVIDLAISDYVELYVYQQVGSSVNLLNSSGLMNYMSVHLLSTG